MTTHLDIEKERAKFEREANDARFFPAELNFARTKSPSGRDEYANSHLQSRWQGWLAARRASLQADVGKDARIDEKVEVELRLRKRLAEEAHEAKVAKLMCLIETGYQFDWPYTDAFDDGGVAMREAHRRIAEKSAITAKENK